MKFQSLTELRQHLAQKESFQNQIKGKRIRKQLSTLDQMECNNFSFKQFEVSDIAIIMHIIVPVNQKPIKFAIRLDFQYPFSPPQIYSTGSQYKKLAYCQDLLKFFLKDQHWGPSLTLSFFLEKIDKLANAIVHNQEIPRQYHPQFQYSRQQLQQYSMKLIEIQEYQWKYFLKSAKNRIVGLTDTILLIFDKISDSIFRLNFWAPATLFTKVKANKKQKSFSLQLLFPDQKTNKEVKLYIGGSLQSMDQILSVLNPLQMIERKIQNLQKSGIQNYEQAIKYYTILIEHYSLTKPDLSKKYMLSMKKVIQAQYQVEKQEIVQQKGAKMVQAQS